MEDLDQTLSAVKQHGWELVMLMPRSKTPLVGRSWHVTSDVRVISAHVARDGNVGLVCGPRSKVAVLDFDRIGSLVEMCSTLGPLQIWVETGSGKSHCYVEWQDGLPARIMWGGQVVGEIQRGPALQHVVMPPSVHPDTGRAYRWMVDPTSKLPALPDEWLSHLKGGLGDLPGYVRTTGDLGHPSAEVWDGPSPEELRIKALSQPGARQRRAGIKFRCPGCAKEGKDRSKDNAILYSDGRWGCAIDPRHKKAIGSALGVESVARTVIGDDLDDLRVTLDDLD